MEKVAVQERGAFRLSRPQIYGGIFRYEHVDFDNSPIDLSGDISSTTLQTSWDSDHFSFGVLVPYDYLSLRALDAHRTGVVLYGQYRTAVTPELSAVFVVNGNYLYTAINRDIRDVNTFGGGVSVALQVDQEHVLAGGALSYQYNADDSDSVNDHQHLLKIGGNLGFRLGDQRRDQYLRDLDAGCDQLSRGRAGTSSKGYLNIGLELGLECLEDLEDQWWLQKNPRPGGPRFERGISWHARAVLGPTVQHGSFPTVVRRTVLCCAVLLCCFSGPLLHVCRVCTN